MRTSSTKNSLIIGISIVLGASLLSVGVSNAAGESIKACAKKSGGAMRLIDSTKNCKKSERTLTWGTQGDAGATGATGAAGSTGATGATGATPTIAYAYINADGTLNSSRSFNAVSSSREGPGLYAVNFGVSTTGCVVTATSYSTQGSSSSIDTIGATSVQVINVYHNGNPQDSDIMVQLVCR